MEDIKDLNNTIKALTLKLKENSKAVGKATGKAAIGTGKLITGGADKGLTKLSETAGLSQMLNALKPANFAKAMLAESPLALGSLEFLEDGTKKLFGKLSSLGEKKKETPEPKEKSVPEEPIPEKVTDSIVSGIPERLDETNYYLVELNDTLVGIQKGIDLMSKNPERLNDQENVEKEFEDSFNKKQQNKPTQETKKKTPLPQIGMFAKILEGVQWIATGAWLTSMFAGAGGIISLLKTGLGGLFNVGVKGAGLAAGGVSSIGKIAKSAGIVLKNVVSSSAKVLSGITLAASNMLGGGVLKMMGSMFGMITKLITSISGPILALAGAGVAGFKIGEFINDKFDLSTKIGDLIDDFTGKNDEMAKSMRTELSNSGENKTKLEEPENKNSIPYHLRAPKDDGITPARQEAEKAEKKVKETGDNNVSINQNTNTTNNVTNVTTPLRDDDPIMSNIQGKNGQGLFRYAWMS